MPMRVPVMVVRAPPLAVAMKTSVGTCVVSELLAVPSRKMGELTVVTVASSAGFVIVVAGALMAVTLITRVGVEMAVLPVSSVATAKTLNRPGVAAL